MLLDDAAYEEVLFGVPRLIEYALTRDASHLVRHHQHGSRRATHVWRTFSNRGIDFEPGIARVVRRATRSRGWAALWIVAAGTDKAMDRARPFTLGIFARDDSHTGKEPQQAYAEGLGTFFLADAVVPFPESKHLSQQTSARRRLANFILEPTAAFQDLCPAGNRSSTIASGVRPSQATGILRPFRGKTAEEWF